MSAPEHWNDQAPRFDDDGAAIDAFLSGADDGVAPGLQIEGEALAVRVGLPPHWAVLARMDPGIYLLRADPAPSPQEADAYRQVRTELVSRGFDRVDLEQPAFTRVAGMVIVGTRIADWELWAVDHDEARECLRRTLVGDATAEPLATADATVGMTLEELLGTRDDLRDIDRRLDEIADQMRGDNRDEDDGPATG